MFSFFQFSNHSLLEAQEAQIGMEDIVIVGAGIAGLATSLGLHRIVSASVISGIQTSELPFRALNTQDDLEIRCVNRRVLLETLENELPKGTIRYSSKVVDIQCEDHVKSVTLADGTVLKTKVLIGWDGVNSEKEKIEDPSKLKLLILSKLGKVSDEIGQVFGETELENMVCALLRFRYPWEMLWGNISKDNVCFLGDALHPMTHDMAQGGCCALEDSAVLARLLGGALKGNDDDNEHRAVLNALEKLARERRWRCFDLICTSYMVGFMQPSDGLLLQFLRDKLMARLMAGVLLKKASFDFADLNI